jgi:hypothetical protein
MSTLKFAETLKTRKAETVTRVQSLAANLQCSMFNTAIRRNRSRKTKLGSVLFVAGGAKIGLVARWQD